RVAARQSCVAHYCKSGIGSVVPRAGVGWLLGKQAPDNNGSQPCYRDSEGPHLLRQRIEPEAALVARVAAIARRRCDCRNIRGGDHEGGVVDGAILRTGKHDDEEMRVGEKGVTPDPT